MEEFKRFIEEHKEEINVIGKVAEEHIGEAEKQLSLKFSEEMRLYLNNFGVISFKYIELFGLGVKEKSHLNILKRTRELREEKNFHEDFVVFEDLGDGHFAVCNAEGEVYEWASPNYSGEVKKINTSFLNYLLKRLKSVV